MVRRALTALTLLLCMAHPGLAQTDPGEGAGAAFNFGVGARALGMGGAFVAVANDYSATYWNSAGMVQVETMDIGAMNTNKFGLGIQYNHLGAVGALHADLFDLMTVHGAGGAGFSISSIGGIETFGPGGESTGTTTSIESLLVGSLAGGVRIGFLELSASRSVKRYAHSLARKSGTGWGADYGVLIDLFDVVSAGYARSDLGGTDIEWSDGVLYTVPSQGHAGASLHFLNDALVASGQVDLENGFDVQTRRWGMELNLFRVFKASWFPADVPWWLIPLEFSLRTGAKIADGPSQTTYGVGFRVFSWLAVDAALVLNNTLGNSLVVSANAEF